MNAAGPTEFDHLRRVVVLTGGVGGARLVDGLYRLLGSRLTCIVNTGDDFEHWGLWISPDVDTVMYTLAGLSDRARGWGLADETFAARDMMARFGGESWFNLGDRDLATHLARTERLRRGEPLSSVTAELCAALGVEATVLPMADRPRATFVTTRDLGVLPFQRWLVQQRAPAVESIAYEGTTEPAAGVIAAIELADLVVLAPSNPYVSIEPITTLTGASEAVAARPVVGVSPIVGGRAVKGPLAAMLGEVDGVTPSAAAVAARYDGLLDAFVVEHGDAFNAPDLAVHEAATVMKKASDRVELARTVLAVGSTLLG